MKVIPPVTITDAILTSSTCSEPFDTEVIYNSGTTYALADEVISTSTHRKFESLQSTNLNHGLPIWPETENDWWIDIGPTNKWAVFDLYRNTSTYGSSPLIIVLTPGVRVNSIALLGIEADTYRIIVEIGSTLLYDTGTIALSTRVTGDWYEYFFGPMSFNSSVILTDLPPYSDVIITVALERASGYVSCSSLAVGSFVDLGKTQYNAESDTLNFSIVDRDIFGNSVLQPRRSVPKTTQLVIANKSLLANIRAARITLNAIPAIWFGIDDTTHDFFEALLIVGYYRKFSINLSRPNEVLTTLELEEV